MTILFMLDILSDDPAASMAAIVFKEAEKLVFMSDNWVELCLHVYQNSTNAKKQNYGYCSHIDF